MADTRFAVDYAKRNAKCQKCKQQLAKGQIRLAKLVPNIFSDSGGDMKQYHHPACLFDTFKRARATTKIIEEPGDIEGWQDVAEDDKEAILALMREHEKFAAAKSPAGNKKKAPTPRKAAPKSDADVGVPAKKDDGEPTRERRGEPGHKDNSFKEFRKLVAKIAEISSYNAKTELVKSFFDKGTEKSQFKGDLCVWVRLLLPGVVKRIYNLQSKQLVKVFSRIFGTSEPAMLADLEQGDVAETVAGFFEQSKNVRAADKATLSVHDVDEFLDKLTKLTREDDQAAALSTMAERCTNNELKMIIRLIKGDLRMQAGAKHVLDALHKDAHEAFNSSRQIDRVVDRIVRLRDGGKPDGPLDVGASLMAPVQPMLAMACKSVDMAFAKCPNGMYSEIKYDGERVQLHKSGSTFKYFSRSLKPVLPHKVAHFKDHIPKAFPGASDLIIDAEVLMVDNKTGSPLPFGTLGVHKAAGFSDATPCLFVFDCLYFNGENLMARPLAERKKLLNDNMVEVGNNVKFSEMKSITRKAQLSDMIKDVLQQGLEGLVLKDTRSLYEPGKRHWLKVKKDYLNEGAMADSADLVVLGAWYGTGNRGGLMSVFLMGVRDERPAGRWRTVTKVHTGHDDATLDRLQKELAGNMTKIRQDYDRVPAWLDCTRQMAPDFVARDPKSSPVWEVTGAEFSKADIHTASGISIRFPRVTKIRADKTWETATSLQELESLYEESKRHTDINLDYSDEASPTKMKKSPEKLVKTPTKQEAGGSGGRGPTSVHDKIREEKSRQIAAAALNSAESPLRMANSRVTKVKLGPSGKSCDKVLVETDRGMVLEVVRRDLFDERDASLAHCISQDLRLGKGIAKAFREKFGVPKNSCPIGDVAVMKAGPGRFVYNLVTKAKYSGFPTYESLRQSLEAMRKHAADNRVGHIAMPKLGCGLDKLDWNPVRTLIKNVFAEDAVRITVCHLDKEREAAKKRRPADEAADAKRRKTTADFPLLDIMEGNLTPINDNSPGQGRSSDGGALKLDGLPDVFAGDKIFLQAGLADAQKLERYIISYGGTVVAEHEFGEANVVVVGDASKPVVNAFGLLSKKKAAQVRPKWLVDSIKRQQRQNVDDHLVR